MYCKRCLQRFSYVFPPPMSHKEPELSSSDSITGGRCDYHSPVACKQEIKTWTIRGITHLYALTLTCDILDPPVWNLLFWKTSQLEEKKTCSIKLLRPSGEFVLEDSKRVRTILCSWCKYFFYKYWRQVSVRRSRCESRYSKIPLHKWCLTCRQAKKWRNRSAICNTLSAS